MTSYTAGQIVELPANTRYTSLCALTQCRIGDCFTLK